MFTEEQKNKKGGDEPLVISLPFETRRGMTWESEATHCISGLKSLFPTQMRCILRTDPGSKIFINCHKDH
jgi:hypothetical protein